MVKVTKRKAYKDVWQRGLLIPEPKRKSGYRFDRSQPDPDGDALIAKKGEEYYTWPLWGDKHLSVSKEYPKRQMLTKSDFTKSIYDIEDAIDAALKANLQPLDRYNLMKRVFRDIAELADMQVSKVDNMPEHLRDLHVGSLLQDRAQRLYDWLSDITQQYSIAQGKLPIELTKFQNI